MSIAVACPHCDAQLSVRDDMAGRRGKCPKCSQPIDIPAPLTVAALDTVPARSTDTIPTGANTARSAPAAKAPSSSAVSADQIAATVREALPALTTTPAPAASTAATVSRLAKALHYLAFPVFGGALAYHYFMHQSWAENAPETPGAIIYWLLLVLAIVLTLMSLLSHVGPPRRKLAAGVHLPREKAPLLLDLVADVSKRVDAPEPRCVALWDATLSQERGELRVGMSALGNMTVGDVLGVLTREIAMERSAGRRLARAEYTRLRRLLGELDPGEKLSLLGKLLSGIGAFGRPVVWPLMVMVRSVAESELRQAELEADAIQCELVGSRSFLTTIQRLRLINYGTELAAADLPFQFREKSLRADRVKTVDENLQTLPPEVQQSILETPVDEPHADWQPTLQERVEAAQKLAAPGVLKCPAAARILVTDFEGLSRETTWIDCSHRFGNAIKRRDLVK